LFPLPTESSAALGGQVGSYFNLESRSKVIVRHEDLFELELLAPKLMRLTELGFRLRPGATSISYPPLHMQGLNRLEKYRFTHSSFEGAKAFAQNREHWIAQYSQRDLHFISEQLDGALLNALNYTLEAVSPVADEAAVTNVTVTMRSMLLRAERHTGSHFLASILRRNFPKGPNQIVHAEPIMHSSDCPIEQPAAPSSSCCWKHGLADSYCIYRPEPSAFVFLVRHPYSWLLAMKANPYEYDGYWLKGMNGSFENMTLSEFIRRPYLTQGRGTLDANDDGGGADRPSLAEGKAEAHSLIATVEYANPMKMWNAKVASYVGLKAAKVFVRHEDLFDLPALTSSLLPLTKCGFTLAANDTVSYPGFTEVNTPLEYRFSRAQFEKAQASAKGSSFGASQFSEKDRELVGSQIDPALLRAVGYSSTL
jgi:hypothetical protein